jgi:D-alanine-D-alanine ligase
MRVAFTHNLQSYEQIGRTEGDSAENVAIFTQALTNLGHVVQPIEVSRPLPLTLAALERFAPDIVFNMAEGLQGRFREGLFPAVFEALGLAYTGSDAYVCTLTLDKWLTKAVVVSHGVPTPRSVLVTCPGSAALADLRFPVIAKPNFEGSSLGITQDSVADSPAALEITLARLLREFPSGILVEEFVVGKDLFVPFIEHASPASGGVLCAYELLVDESIAGRRRHAIYDFDMKHSLDKATSVQAPAELSDALATRVAGLTRTAVRALGIRDLGRIDFRVTADGEPYFLEANALPSLNPGAGIFASAALAGMGSMEELFAAVLASAVARQPAKFACA